MYTGRDSGTQRKRDSVRERERENDSVRESERQTECERERKRERVTEEKILILIISKIDINCFLFPFPC